MEINLTLDDQKVFDRLKSTGRITHSLRRLMTKQWNACCVCRGIVSKGRPVFAGYDNKSSPLFVGACCADHLVELATPTYWGMSGTQNISVDDNQPLWRYMDFAKFAAMLTQRGLYFPSAANLEDPFEGAVGLARRETEWDKFYLEYFRQIVTIAPPGYPAPDFTPERIELEAQRLLSEVKFFSVQARASLVSCWHANTVESEALWRLYSPPPVVGVAIRTTAGALWDATAMEPSVIIGKVRYIDFKKAYANNDQRLFYKRLSLSHENEVRAVIQSYPDRLDDGRVVSCDLSTLIETVVISPFAPRWAEEMVSNIVKLFGFNFEVRLSELLEEPFY